MQTIQQEKDPAIIRKIIREILESLPQWFGIPEAIDEYVEGCIDNPCYIYYIDNYPVGMIAIKHHFAQSAEIYVMGVVPSAHRQGIGRQLIYHCESICRQDGIRYLQVKTLDATHPDPYYAKTRQFYEALGFAPLECFPTLWDPSNPCLLMIKHLDN